MDEEEFQDCKLLLNSSISFRFLKIVNLRPKSPRLLYIDQILTNVNYNTDFTNPIKRKEFDRQRKRQQMREMQNVSAFKQVSIHSPSRNKIEFIRNLTFGCFYFNLTLLI